MTPRRFRYVTDSLVALLAAEIQAGDIAAASTLLRMYARAWMAQQP